MRLASSLRHLALAGLVTALPWRTYGADTGFKIGDLGRLHLKLEIASHYDSNLFFASSGRPLSGYAVDVIPGFNLAVAGSTASLDLTGSVDRKQYLTEEAKDLSRFFGSASLGASVNREGALGLELTDTFSRSDQTASLSIAQSVIASHNQLKLGVPFRPGGGALALTLAGHWVRESFETYVSAAGCDPGLNPTCVAAGISAYGYNQYGGGGEVRWKFLPRTAIVIDGGYFQRKPDDTALSREVRGLKVSAGLAGLFTPRIAATVKGGWGTAFDSPGFGYSTWLANAEVEYVTQGAVGAKLGYLHSFQADPGSEYSVYEQNRVYLDGKMLIAGRLTIRGAAGWDRLRYVINGVTSSLLSFSPAVEYEVMRWIYVGASYSLTARTSSLGAAVPAFDFTRHQGTLRLVFSY